MKITLHRNYTWSRSDGLRGLWTRHYNGRIDRGVPLGGWSGGVRKDTEGPVFETRRELVEWIGALTTPRAGHDNGDER